MAESNEDLKRLLMNVKEESEKSGLKLNIQKEYQSYGLCGRGRVWDDLGEWHWNM